MEIFILRMYFGVSCVVLDLVEQLDRPQHVFLVGLDDDAVQHHLVQDEMRTLQVEHYLTQHQPYAYTPCV